MAEKDGGVVGVKYPADIYEALQAYTKELASKGDPMLSEASVVRTMTVECLRRAGRLGSSKTDGATDEKTATKAKPKASGK